MPQDKQLLSPKEKTPVSKWWNAVKALVTLLIVGYVAGMIQKQHGLSNLTGVIASLADAKHLPAMLLLLAMVPLNWALESWKWKLLAQKAVPITFREAFRTTLTGLAVGVAIPAQLGDTLGRVTSLKSDHRLKTLGAALVSNGIQFYVSVLGGAISWFIVSPSLAIPVALWWAITCLLPTLLLLGIVAGLLRNRLPGLTSKRPWVQKLRENLAVIGHYSHRELLRALFLGFARYLVFVAQFALALSLFDPAITATSLLACVGLILLTKTLVPVINAIGDLGVREFTALYVFAPFQLPAEHVVAATFFIWLINILAPLLVGIYFIWKYKWSFNYV
jgi:uncharacterized membrane protein YbhN (UPF0104 family)